MKVLTPDEYPLLAPNVCFVCEMAASEQLLNAGIKFVDSGRSFNAGAPTHLTGRKYLCSSCVTDAATLLGWHHSDALDQAKADLKEVEARLARFTSEVQNFSGSLIQTVKKGAK